MSKGLEQSIKEEAGRLGFVLAGLTTPEPPPHLQAFEGWLNEGRHATMRYLEEGRARRASPRLLMPECKSILVLAAPYSNPRQRPDIPSKTHSHGAAGKIAAYAWGRDYHDVFRERMESLVVFIRQQVEHPVASRLYTDTGPILERDLAQRAGLGWIGKNTCLINPKRGSYFLLAEILLDLELAPDEAFPKDHCGKCTRCITACPTQCILPDRTLDAGRCLSYLTIELKEGIPPGIRPLIRDWVFGCDICQIVCPWNRFAASQGDPAFDNQDSPREVGLLKEIELTSADFKRSFKDSPVRRTKRRGYLRNIATVLGNRAGAEALPALDRARQDPDPIVQEHATWAIDQIQKRLYQHETTVDRHQQQG